MLIRANGGTYIHMDRGPHTKPASFWLMWGRSTIIASSYFSVGGVKNVLNLTFGLNNVSPFDVKLGNYVVHQYQCNKVNFSFLPNLLPPALCSGRPALHH